MEKVIETYLNEAAKARDWQGHIHLQWALVASESSQIDVLDTLMIQKHKSY
jgi:hypothetical protein